MRTVKSEDGTPIAFESSGHGLPVVLVSAAFQTRSDPRSTELAGRLSQDFTVFNYDRRGRGDSGDTPPYEVEREIEDLEAIVSEAGGSASLYGGSSGGSLALHATAAGLPISRVAVHEPNFLVDDSRPPLPDEYVSRLEELVSAGRRGDAVEYFMTVAVGMPAEMVAPMRDMPMWADMEATAHTLAYDGRIVDGFRLPTERLQSIGVPVLVVDGDATAPWLRTGADAGAAALPAGTRRTLAGEQHNVAAEAISPLLREFLAT